MTLRLLRLLKVPYLRDKIAKLLVLDPNIALTKKSYARVANRQILQLGSKFVNLF